MRILGDSTVGGKSTVGYTRQMRLSSFEYNCLRNFIEKMREFSFRAGVKAFALRSGRADDHPSPLFRLGLPIQMQPSLHQRFGLIARGKRKEHRIGRSLIE